MKSIQIKLIPGPWLLCLGALCFIHSSAWADPTSYSTNFDAMNPGSIFGQEGWANLNSDPSYPYNQAVTNDVATAHSGAQSWLVSNSTNDGTVRAIGTPTFAQVGESHTVFGGTPAYNQATESFWFRTVSTTPDPGLYVSNSLGTAASVRNTWVGITEDSGNLFVDGLGYDYTTHDFTQDANSGPLIWGAWYQIRETATFLDGPNNDTVRYQLFDALGNSVMDQTVGSWEGYYSDNPGAEQSPGPVASNQVSWGLFNSPGVQGIYVDDFSVSVQAVPEASTWAVGALAMAALVVQLLRARGFTKRQANARN
jgi:hypothetical protein